MCVSSLVSQTCKYLCVSLLGTPCSHTYQYTCISRLPGTDCDTPVATLFIRSALQHPLMVRGHHRTAMDWYCLGGGLILAQEWHRCCGSIDSSGQSSLAVVFTQWLLLLATLLETPMHVVGEQCTISWQHCNNFAKQMICPALYKAIISWWTDNIGSGHQRGRKGSFYNQSDGFGLFDTHPAVPSTIYISHLDPYMCFWPQEHSQLPVKILGTFTLMLHTQTSLPSPYYCSARMTCRLVSGGPMLAPFLWWAEASRPMDLYPVLFIKPNCEVKVKDVLNVSQGTCVCVPPFFCP